MQYCMQVNEHSESTYRSEWWVHKRVYQECLQECVLSFNRVHYECIHECMQECLYELMSRFHRSSGWVHTRFCVGVIIIQGVHAGAHDACIHECMQESFQEFMRSFYRIVRWIRTGVHVGDCMWVHDQLLQDWMMSACKIVCRSDDYAMSSYRSARWLHTRVYVGVCTSVMLVPWWVHTRLYALVFIWVQDFYRSDTWMHAIVYSGVSMWVHAELLQEFMMSAYNLLCRSYD